MSARRSERLLANQRLQEAQRLQQECRERQLELQRGKQECREWQRLEAAAEPLAAAAPLNHDAPENRDANDYHDRIRNTCFFLTCAVCALEEGIKTMQCLTPDLKSSVVDVMSPFWILFVRDFPVDVVSTLEQPGFLVGANHICNECLKLLKSTVLPKRALVNGFCCGSVPHVLSILNRTEISMISIVCPLVKVELHKGGMKSRTDVISYTNNVSFIATRLPRLPQAILRAKTRSIQNYRPQLIFDALQWLKHHNKLYCSVELIFPPEWSDIPQAVPDIVFDEDNAADDDPSATNPSAVVPTETFIIDYDTGLSSISSMAALVMDRPDGSKVQRHECENFDGMAFPLLYPYGVGFPAGKDIDFSYINHRIQCGSSYRRFAETSDWLFTHYSYELRMKNGGIAAQAAKMRETNDRVTDEDTALLISFLKSSNITDPVKMTRIRKILKFVQPFAAAIPGSYLAMEQERNRLRSLVNSPITTKNGHWRWFFTQAQSDLHSPLIYDNLVQCADSISAAAAADVLSKEQRRLMLIKNPVIPVRCWKLQQQAFFDCILNGFSKPLGGEIIDYVDKTEFQVKATVHSHYMLCIKDPNLSERDADALSEATQQKIVDIVNTTVQANSLQIETGWDWQPSFLQRPLDKDQPERFRFSPTLDYTTRSGVVMNLCRQLQLSSFFHSCRDGCYPHCKHLPSQLRTCRYDYPWHSSFSSESATIVEDKDRKGRPRIRVLPARNNANVAPMPQSSLMVIANNGNSNLQFMTNKYGCTEYIGGYVGKVDLPESKCVIDTALKLLSLDTTTASSTSTYRALLNAVSNGRRVSNTEVALYFLEGKKGILKYSRKCVNVNTNLTADLDVPLNIGSDGVNGLQIDIDDAEESATGYHVKMRTHYGTFCQCQLVTHGHNDVSLYSFVTSFRVDKPLPALKNGKTRPLVHIPLFNVDDQTGEVTNRMSFEYRDIRFVALQRCHVVHISPWFKMTFNLDCCRKLLFLYVPWPNGREHSYPDPVHSWHDLSPPEYATICIDKEIHRQQLNVGIPVPNGASNEMHENSDESDNASHDDYDEHREVDIDQHCRGRTYNHEMARVSVVNASVLDASKRYLSDLKQRLVDESSVTSRLNQEQIAMKDVQPSLMIPHDNHEEKMLLLEQMQDQLTADQALVVHSITSHIMTPSKGQLVGLISGEGGTGKTQIMKVVKLWCETLYGKVQGSVGCCAIGAPTGPAAFNVGGDTWQGLFHRGQTKLVKTKEDVKGVKDLRERFKGLQLLMFDEVSMIGALALWEIHIRCTLACDNDDKTHLPFGGYNVIFFGDFYQLDPVNDTSLVKQPSDVKGEVLSSITMLRASLNYFFELTENVRARRGFGGISPFASGLMHIRLGVPTDDDIAYFTSLFKDYDHCVANPQHAKEIFIFAFKKSVQKHNETCLNALLSSNDPQMWGLRVIAEHKRNVKGQSVLPSASDAQLLLQMTKGKSKEHPAYVDLAIGSRVRLTANLCIPLGLTNGAQGTVVSFMFGTEPPSEQHQWPRFGHMGVASANREIPVVVVAWDYDIHDSQACTRAQLYSFDPMIPNVFPISQTEVNGTTYKLKGKCWSRFQLPLVAGHGRTGHSCQGLTSHFGITVADLNSQFFNYVYVAMSRAKLGEHTRLVAPYGQYNVFKRDYCQPHAKKRDAIDAFYEYLRARFPR